MDDGLEECDSCLSHPPDAGLGICAMVESMGEKAKRADPLWLRIIVALVLSCVFSLLTLLMVGDVFGPISMYLCGALAIVSTVLMAWKGRRVGTIATWFMELLSGI